MSAWVLVLSCGRKSACRLEGRAAARTLRWLVPTARIMRRSKIACRTISPSVSKNQYLRIPASSWDVTIIEYAVLKSLTCAYIAGICHGISWPGDSIVRIYRWRTWRGRCFRNFRGRRTRAGLMAPRPMPTPSMMTFAGFAAYSRFMRNRTLCLPAWYCW